MKLLLVALFGSLLSTSAALGTLHPGSIEPMVDKAISYNFGGIPINSSKSANFIFKNYGTRTLYLRSLWIMGSAITGTSNCPTQIEPEQTCLTRVTATPWSEGSFIGRVIYVFPDFNYHIELYGWGVR